MKRAFTLIELLVVIAIIAILAAILFPVFAQAKVSAKVTSSLSGIKQVALALHMYSTDFDDMAVWEYGYSTAQYPYIYHNTNTWVGRVEPYVKNKNIFFDKLKSDPRETQTLSDGSPVFFDPFYNDQYRWQWATNFSLNTDGYSRHWGGTGCTAIDWNANNGQGSSRSLTAFEDPAARMVVSPMRYANLDFGWMRFYGIDAAWPTSDRYASGWDWYNLIWDSRREYPGPKFVAAFADGHAGKFGREKFVHYYVDTPSQTEANTYNEFCAKMDQKKLWPFWGRAWSGD